MSKEYTYQVRNMEWFRRMTFNASMPKFSIKLSKYVRLRIWLGLKLIHLGCITLGVGYTFTENSSVVIE